MKTNAENSRLIYRSDMNRYHAYRRSPNGKWVYVYQPCFFESAWYRLLDSRTGCVIYPPPDTKACTPEPTNKSSISRAAFSQSITIKGAHNVAVTYDSSGAHITWEDDK